MRAWSSVPGCSLRVVNGGAVDMCVGSGLNTIVFNNCDGRFSSSFGGGVLALGGFAYGPDDIVVNNVHFISIRYGFISVNPFGVDYASDHCIVQEILTHEMGHSLGLHHSWQPSFGDRPAPTEAEATMYFVAHFDGRCASLKQDRKSVV